MNDEGGCSVKKGEERKRPMMRRGWCGKKVRTRRGYSERGRERGKEW